MRSINIEDETFNFVKYKEHQLKILQTSNKFGLDLLSIKPQVILINGENKDMEDFCRNNLRAMHFFTCG